VVRRVLAFALAVLATGCTGSGTAPPPTSTLRTSTPHDHAVDGTSAARAVPRFAHLVVVVEENRAYGDVIGSPDAPYINRLARTGTLLTRSYGVTHPSEPNYLALFSGSTHALADDSCPHSYSGRNLAAQLIGHGQTFAGYAESLPHAGYAGCTNGAYARKHAPWTNFTDVPASVGKPMRRFPSDFNRLPRVSFVVPNLEHDMHDGTIAQADTWLRRHLAQYVHWAHTHNSLLIVTWDEDDRSANNHIPGLLAGAHVPQLRYSGRVDHYRMLRTIEAACGLPAVGAAAHRRPIAGVWTQ
jgi:acid phosphatase